MNGVETLGLVIIGIAIVLAFVQVVLGQRARSRYLGSATAMRTSWESQRGELGGGPGLGTVLVILVVILGIIIAVFGK